MINWSPEAETIMMERFGKDTILALATADNGVPYVRNVNAYYEDGAFYVITHALSNKMKHFFSRLKTTVTVFVEALLEERRASNLKPEFFEISINGDGINSPSPTVLSLEGGASAVLTGIADRIDVYRKDGKAYIRVVDYKTGTYTFSPKRLDKGLDMQMLIYLLALCTMKDCDFKKKLLGNDGITEIKPQGIVYLTYNINKTDADYETDLFSADADSNESDELLGKVVRSGMELDDTDLKASNDAFNLKEGSLSAFEDFDEIFEIVKSNIERLCLDMLRSRTAQRKKTISRPQKV